MKLFAGIDALSLDNREFHPSKDDIQRICRFFAVGKLKSFKKEKDILISHSNFFVFVATSQGQYALKFYPSNAARSITVEYALNRLLTARHFPTPLMYAGRDGQPSMASNGRLATCYSFINGVPAWKKIRQAGTIQQINAALLSLKKILTEYERSIPCPKQESLPQTISSLVKMSRLNAPFDRDEMINASLRDALGTYQLHQPLFKRQRLHNNANLSNFLIHQKTIHLLDLSHVREDYYLADLASLIISCLFFDVPASAIKNITHNYFTQDKIKLKDPTALNTLVKVGLIKEYLKNIQRGKSARISAYPSEIVRNYRSHLAQRKKLIAAVLKKMTCH